MAAVDQRRKQKESLKYLKEVAAEKAKAKADEKRAGEDALKQWKRHRGDAEHAASANDVDGGAGGKNKKGGREAELEAAIAGHQKKFDEDRRHSGRGPSAKRKAKDRRYGHGGPKRDSKDNTARSSGDFRSFSARRNNTPSGAFAGRGGGGGKFGKKNAGASRPGKRFRSSSRGGKR
jgi:rRNA-processing protein EBP2